MVIVVVLAVEVVLAGMVAVVDVPVSLLVVLVVLSATDVVVAGSSTDSSDDEHWAAMSRTAMAALNKPTATFGCRKF